MKMAKIRATGSFLICFALLLALGYGIVGIYSSFFHTIDDGFYSMNVYLQRNLQEEENAGGGDHPPSGPRGGNSSSYSHEQNGSVKELLGKINKWGQEENALLLINGSGPQILFSDNTHTREILNATVFEGVTSGLYLPEPIMNDLYYVRDGVFFPNRQRIEIQGIIDISGLSRLRKTSYWLLDMNQYQYPVEKSLDSTVIITDSPRYKDLRELLENNGYEVLEVYSGKTSFQDFLKIMTGEKTGSSLYDSSSKTLMLLTIAFSFVVVYMTYWKGCVRREQVRHLCGKASPPGIFEGQDRKNSAYRQTGGWKLADNHWHRKYSVQQPDGPAPVRDGQPLLSPNRCAAPSS